ncbi:hypothetical protein D3C78_959800 [compost metagenome]
MLRVGEKFLARALLHCLALGNDQHVIGDVAHHGKIVADKNIGQFEFFLQISEQVQHLRLHRKIERGDRFIQHQQRRVQHQCARDGDTLALAAREHVRIAVEMLRTEADLHQHGFGALAALGSRHFRVDEQRLHQHITHFLARVEAAIGVLEHHLHLGAHDRIGAALGDIDRLAFDLEFTAGCRVDQRDDAGKRRLARTGLTDDGERLAALDGKIDAFEGLNRLGAAKDAAGNVIMAGNALAFDNDTHWTPSLPKKSETVGRRSPVAFSGRAESSALV